MGLMRRGVRGVLIPWPLKVLVGGIRTGTGEGKENAVAHGIDLYYTLCKHSQYSIQTPYDDSRVATCVHRKPWDRPSRRGIDLPMMLGVSNHISCPPISSVSVL
jgi:hypothetical protein